MRVLLLAVLLLLAAVPASARSLLVVEIQTELDRLGFQPGPPTGTLNNRTLEALDRAARRGIVPHDAPVDGNLLRALRQAAVGRGGDICEGGRWVFSVTPDGARVELSDRSVWIVEAPFTAQVAGWTFGEAVETCPTRIVNPATADEIRARRLR